MRGLSSAIAQISLGGAEKVVLTMVRRFRADFFATSLAREDVLRCLDAIRRPREGRARAFDEERFILRMGTILEAIVSKAA